MKIERPPAGEYPAFFERYVSRVPETDVVAALESQPAEVRRLLGPLTPERAAYRYADGKWTVRQVVGHFIDTERVFGYRTLRFARGDATPLPGFEEDDYAKTAGHEHRDLPSLLDEFTSLRASHVLMLRGLPDAAWARSGSASGHPVSVRASAFIMVGHVRHHLGVLETKYGIA